MGVNFDLFIKHREYVPENLRRYINQAKLFVFDSYPTQSLDGVPFEDVESMSYNFCLPFPVVAVEDKTSCTIIWDLDKNVVGMDHERGMMEIIDTRNYLASESFSISSQDKDMGITENDRKESIDGLKGFAEEMGGYPILFRSGRCSLDWEGSIQKWKGNSRIDDCIYYGANGIKHDLLDADVSIWEAANTDFLRGMITSYEWMLRMSVVHQFIQEKKPKKKIKRTKYLKSSERPTYTVVSPNKARKTMGVKSSSSSIGSGKRVKERRAHVRREHVRVLRSEVFTKKRGKSVSVRRSYIPAIWEGKNIGEDSKHFYRVILDLPKGIRDSCVGEEKDVAKV